MIPRLISILNPNDSIPRLNIHKLKNPRDYYIS